MSLFCKQLLQKLNFLKASVLLRTVNILMQLPQRVLLRFFKQLNILEKYGNLPTHILSDKSSFKGNFNLRKNLLASSFNSRRARTLPLKRYHF